MSFGRSVTVIAGILGASTLIGAPPAKILLRYHPRPGTGEHFRSYSYYYLGGTLMSGPRPEHSLTLYGWDSVVSAGGDSIVRRLEIDSLSRTDAGQSPGLAPARLLFEATWSDRRTLRGGIRGTTSPGALNHMIPDVLGGITRFPDDSVAVGDSWKDEGTYHVVEVQDTLGSLRTRVQAKLKSLTIDGADTLAVFHLKVRLDGPEWFFKDMQQTQQLSGTLEGDEVYSMSRGVTDSLSLTGTITTDFDLGGGRRGGLPTKISLVRVTTRGN
ncbi:MAG TPA: hypothetical protein VH113_04640 [Gemmatimonadales bacterium]|nr:hypothetical protein [Gemmatimonadales bacterium]